MVAVDGRRVRTGEPLHFELVEFLEDEATTLDRGDLLDWLGLLTEDIRYQVPVRQTRVRDDGPGFSPTSFHLNEDLMSLTVKATRLATTASSWAENPPSRTRRFVTNIRATARSGVDGEEFDVTSSLLLVRSRYNRGELRLITAGRQDVVRRVDGSWRLAQRTVYLDEATLGVENLAVFL